MTSESVTFEVTDWLEAPDTGIPKTTPREVLVDGGWCGEVTFAEVDRLLGGDWSPSLPEGKLRTRINDAYYKAHGSARASMLLGSSFGAGVNAYLNSLPNRITHYRFTDELTWREREYGATRSCYWTWNRKYRALLVKAGGGALITRDEDTPNGRMWLLPYYGALIGYNSRGPKRQQFDIILGHHFKVEVKTNLQFELHARPVFPGGVVESGTWSAFYSETRPSIVGEPAADPPTTAHPYLLDACHCMAYFNCLEVKGLPICEKCPFPRTRNIFCKDTDELEKLPAE